MERSERVNYLCRAFGRIHRSMLRGNRRGPELRPSEAGALWTIDHAGDGGIHPSEVSRRMSMARPSLTPILRELEAKGPDPALTGSGLTAGAACSQPPSGFARNSRYAGGSIPA